MLDFTCLNYASFCYTVHVNIVCISYASLIDLKQWDKSEDRLALFGLGFAAIVALWASTNLISAIDKLPLIPSAFELIGILYSSWFVYRYLLFKPDREELFQIISKSVSDILGQ
ncbi:hypothetical protein GH714_035380 [Hevea brasiliensis]|uniref:Cyanobacterial aminoacyl-tRNA synthetase CAAD domain-containing protein n=1 Tax=Hevea brasiliensis TaxID=3981 RepID=A0A6A6NB48_HEVBR|nr:hypothetical protein GH714_035380 [Hevea brasiliensis]